MMEMLGGAFDSSQIPIIGITGQPITTLGGNCTRVGMDPLELQRRIGSSVQRRRQKASGL